MLGGSGELICEGGGKGVAIGGHGFINCIVSNQLGNAEIYKLDRHEAQPGCFKAWSNEILRVRHRHSGANHLALIVNILWQVWKNRNELEFNNKKRQSVQIVQNTHEKWIKYSDAHRQGETTSTE